jgi:SAM-dependent methyltransferase
MDGAGDGSFESLVAEADAAAGAWDFGWLAGRASERRPSWGYQRLIGEYLPRARVALDIETGSGSVLAGLDRLAPCTFATEAWPPNVTAAREALEPRGVSVLAAEADRLPFRDGVFDLVLSRHPVAACWPEIARVLAPGGRYLSQEVGPRSMVEISEWFLGPPEPGEDREPERARAAAEAAGLRVADLRTERLETVFHDIGAVVYYLRTVIWIVPGFSVRKYRERLRELDRKIRTEGRFTAYATRFLIEAVKEVRT